MKRYICKLICGGLLSAPMTFVSSCSDNFLKEEMVGSLTTAHFDTPEGLDALEVALYQGLRHFYGEEHAYAMTNYGTDEFQVGGGPDYRWMNDYTSISAVDPKPSFSGLSFWWDTLYGHINTANMVIAKTPNIYGEADVKYKQYMGEAYFLRGFYYFRMLSQYGGIPLKLEPSEELVTEFTRNTEKECFVQIIEDLTLAASLLPAASSDGHITKPAAWHFLAKAHLFRASEKFADITESNDLTEAIKWGLKVINKEDGSDRELAVDYHDFWNFLEEGPNGNAEKSKEILLQAQYSNVDEKKDRLCNRTHLYYLPRYEDGMTGMQRVIQYGRPYQRLRPTTYTYDVFDRVNDSRFWKSFRTLYLSTISAKGADINGQEQSHVVGSTVGIKIIINEASDNRYDDKYNTTTFPNYWVRYNNNGGTNFTVSKFAGLDKYLDPHRTGNQNDINGTRDGFLARIGETYLIVAEAYGRNNDYPNAVKYINYVRERAGYAANENRSEYRNATANSYFSKNTYYESTGLAVTTASTKNTMIITEATFNANTDAGIPYSVFGATTKEQKFIHFILNERTRELCGEFLRWDDLSRTKTLHARTIPYNKDNAALQLEADKTIQKYLLRPIPQTFLDAVTKNGQLLTSQEKTTMQNPGY